MRVTFDLCDDELDDIVLKRLKQDVEYLHLSRKAWGGDYENDFFQGLKSAVRYYMIDSEYQEWVKDYE